MTPEEKEFIESVRKRWIEYTEHYDKYSEYGVMNLLFWMGERVGVLLQIIDQLQEEL